MNTALIPKSTTMFISGLALLAMAAVAAFGYGYAFNTLVGLPESITGFQTYQWLIRSVIVSFTLIALLDIVVAWSLHFTFRNDHEALSLLAAWLRLVYTAMLGASVFHLLPLLRYTDADRMPGTEILDHLHRFLDSWSLGLVIFGAHLFVLGLLLRRSAAVPSYLPIAVLIAAFAYLGTNLANFTFPGYAAHRDTIGQIAALPMALGELGLAVWLMVMAGRNRIPAAKERNASGQA